LSRFGSLVFLPPRFFRFFVTYISASLVWIMPPNAGFVYGFGMQCEAKEPKGMPQICHTSNADVCSTKQNNALSCKG